MKQASICDGFAFDPFSFQQDGLPASEVSISWDQIVDALVIAQMVAVRDEGVDLGFEILREEVVLQQNAVLERLMPALGLSLGHRMMRRTTGVLHGRSPSHLARSPERCKSMHLT